MICIHLQSLSALSCTPPAWNVIMTGRELRKQRREAERKAKKLEYQQNRLAAEPCGAGSLAGEPVARPASETSAALPPNPELLDEFTAGEQSEMMALRARVHARTKPGPTGPRSPEGKTMSSGNSLKHGLASGRVIIPGEDPAEYEALLQELLSEHAPATETEQLLVQQMAQSWWLTQRAIRLQNQAFTETRVDAQKLALFLRYQTTHERAFYKALNALMKLAAARRKSAPEFVSQKPVHEPNNPALCLSVGSRHASTVAVPPPNPPEMHTR